jgi:hypothetical protein
MKKLLAVAGLGAAVAIGSLTGAGAANATPYQDSQYVACVAVDQLYSTHGPSAVAARGREIANHISSGWRDPLHERDWVYYNTDSEIGVTDANFMVNCATQIYLGFGPDDPVPNYGYGGGYLA